MKKKTIKDIDVKGKRVLVRCDFNVPRNKETGEITDNTRIVAALPTIQYLTDAGAKVVLCSHLGRPKGVANEKDSLKPVAEELSNLLGKDVKFATDTTGEGAKTVTDTKNLNEGEVALLENVRFDPREEQNDDTLALELASLSDGIYVNDAFSASHRAHSSTEGVAHHVDEAVAGLLVEEELESVEGALENPKRPFAAILGGSKVSDKIGVIDNLLDKVDEILIGGGMAFTFLKALGYNIGDSIFEEDKIEVAKKIMSKAKSKNVMIKFPKDFRVTKEFSNDTPDKIVDADKIPDGYQGLDIGPKTFKEYSEVIKNAATIIWNGPLGVFEFPKYAIGTNNIAEAVASNEQAISIVGGGDSVAAVNKLGLNDRFTHVSTAGGALIEFLEGKVLPGINCLKDKDVIKKEEQKETKKNFEKDDSKIK